MTSREPRSLVELITALSAKRTAPFIEALTFPRYRNFEREARIEFTFPVTMLLGRNGTNKSALLHALYGSTSGRTPADFWFETDIDTISYEVDGLLQSVVSHHRAAPRGPAKPTLKFRIKRAGNSDYWEASVPRKKYGIADATKRTPSVKMNVEYIDFRAELSAFDKFFNFPDEARLALLDRLHKDRLDRAGKKLVRARKYTKQDYLRRKSRRVLRIIREAAPGANLEPLKKGAAVHFHPDELAAISRIMDRAYVDAICAIHREYGGDWGPTILFKTAHFDGYSEAFAGSGEFAIGVLVSRLMRAPQGSLVLIDEPETSLHPAAKSALKLFVLDQALQKDLQVVVSTHSPEFVEGLPIDAIRVLQLTSAGAVRIRDDLTATEAFREVGATAPKTEIVTEDANAAMVVRAVLQGMDQLTREGIEVRHCAGGASAIYRDIVTYSRENRRGLYVLFDGDQRPSADVGSYFPDDLPSSTLSNSKALTQRISEVIKGNDLQGMGLKLDGGPESAAAYLRFLWNRVEYLPGSYPEKVVWNEDVARRLLQDSPDAERWLSEHGHCVCNARAVCSCYKQKYHALAEKLGGAMTFDSVFPHFVTAFSKSSGADPIRAILSSVRADAALRAPTTSSAERAKRSSRR